MFAADTVRVRVTRSVQAEPGRILLAGTVDRVTPLVAAILRSCNAIELLDADDEPKLREAVLAENRRVLREVSRPAPSLPSDGRWIPRY